MADHTATSLADQLSARELSAAAPIHTGGTITCERPFKLFYEQPDGSAAYITFPADVKDSQKLTALLDSCQPATFGRGTENVLDPTYREALCMSPEKFSLNLPLSASNILWDIQTLLQPEAASITAELYKLNIYGPGGFFKSHKDTPRGPNMFGSLVICLPTPFKGGELVVKKSSTVQFTHAWGTPELPAVAEAAPAGYSLQWAAFYSDMEHEILPVTEGHRITLTYNLFSRPKSPALTNVAASSSNLRLVLSSIDTLSNSSFGTALAQKLQDGDWYPSGAVLGFALEHQYVESTTMPTQLEPYMLKGSDLLLYNVARELGLDVKLLPLIKPRDDYWDERFKFEFGGEVLGASFDRHMHGLVVREEMLEKDFLARRHGLAEDKDIVWLKAPTKDHFRYKDLAIDYGNEYESAHWYVAAVMLVKVPKAPRTLPSASEAALARKRARGA